jgi:glycosyltransferase involved in cell wall biosynthesis
VVGSFYQSQVGITSQRLEVIYNAVEFAGVEPSETRMAARTALGYQESDLVLGGLGRLTEQKAHELLLDAVAEIGERYPTVRLFLAGQGPLQVALEERIRRRGLDERVRLLGLRRDRRRLYAAMDVFVLPSRWEGLSLALVEAAGLGLPIVATDVGGNAEVVGGEVGVWLIRPGDVPALANALGAAVELLQVARRSSGQARYPRPGVRERFSLAAHLAQLETSYRRALGWPASEAVGKDLPPASLVEGRGAS